MRLSKKSHLVKPKGGLKTNEMQSIEDKILGVYFSK